LVDKKEQPMAVKKVSLKAVGTVGKSDVSKETK
jgi:hypothetical protein